MHDNAFRAVATLSLLLLEYGAMRMEAETVYRLALAHFRCGQDTLTVLDTLMTAMVTGQICAPVECVRLQVSGPRKSPQWLGT